MPYPGVPQYMPDQQQYMPYPGMPQYMPGQQQYMPEHTHYATEAPSNSPGASNNNTEDAISVLYQRYESYQKEISNIVNTFIHSDQYQQYKSYFNEAVVSQIQPPTRSLTRPQSDIMLGNLATSSLWIQNVIFFFIEIDCIPYIFTPPEKWDISTIQTRFTQKQNELVHMKHTGGFVAYEGFILYQINNFIQQAQRYEI